MRSFLYLLAKFIGFYVYNLFFLIKVKGKENFPKKGGFIIAANHLSYLDPPTIGYVCPRKLYYMAKSSLFEIKILSFLVKILGAIPIDRNSKMPLSLKKAIEILKKGEGLVFFPEGTRSKDGLIKEPRPGIGLIALKSKVPIIPVRLRGTDKALPMNSKFIRLKKIEVIIGKPLYFDKGSYEEISKKVIEEIRKLQ
ncbi:MAG: 1-acyl-sn-glycerol-3-phosphate acyltransferase [Candidatus Omnitrophica bacterium]|nr:1-acyl-sn-glycerol-3-phosphate acyltransferase [Candidatus Omnitrophota bacterium]MCM8809235.1 1-acyl-sn-glycerol-3-phosphate acyltransferase [Candidatus Omnitrophota bacterium]MCM8810507.1 1-acyl-sn-glycerol-3-phosphate acyltransferase [Candidatus Omnitrophota bacterium]